MRIAARVLRSIGSPFLAFFFLACQSAPPDAATVAAEIDRILSDEYLPQEPGAAILVSRGGETILEKGYGLADLENETPVTADTRFRIASITKAFTSTAILQLVDREMIRLDAPIRELLPELTTLHADLNVEHLLAHTSGLAEYLDRPDFMAWVAEARTVNELLDSFKDRPPLFSPGDENRYSNSNYILLGAMIEHLTGQSFNEFLEENVFEPVGMANTSCGLVADSDTQVAITYEPGPSSDQDWTSFVVGRPYTMSALYAAGGCVSTVKDLFVFHMALMSGALLSEETLALSLAPVMLNDGNTSNGSIGGWQLDRIAGRPAFMKGGSMPGTCTWYLFVPEEALAIMLLTNRTPGQPRCGRMTVQFAEIGIGG